MSSRTALCEILEALSQVSSVTEVHTTSAPVQRSHSKQHWSHNGTGDVQKQSQWDMSLTEDTLLTQKRESGVFL